MTGTQRRRCCGRPHRIVGWQSELADVPVGRALDLGAGEGRNALWLAARGFTVTAVDFAKVALDRGRQQAEAAHVPSERITLDRGGSP